MCRIDISVDGSGNVSGQLLGLGELEYGRVLRLDFASSVFWNNDMFGSFLKFPTENF